MSTSRKTIVTLVVALAAVIGYLGVSPGMLHAATDVEGDWGSNRGAVTLHQNDNDLVWGTLDGPLGQVHVLGHFDGPRILRLAFKGVQHKGSATLFVSSDGLRMTGSARIGTHRFSWRLHRQ